MCFPRNWEFGWALSKLRNLGGGGGWTPPTPTRYATDSFIHVCLPQSPKRSPTTYIHEKHKVTVHGAPADGRPTCSGVRPGSPRGFREYQYLRAYKRYCSLSLSNYTPWRWIKTAVETCRRALHLTLYGWNCMADWKTKSVTHSKHSLPRL
jgi:hypothetical protein